MRAVAGFVAVIAACGCWPIAAQMDEKPPVIKRSDGGPSRSSKKKDDSDSTKPASGVVNAAGIIRHIDGKTIQVEAEDNRLITCNLTAGTAMVGPSGKLTFSDFEPGMRVKIQAKLSTDGEELTATSVEIDNPTSMPNEKTATIREGPPDEEGRPVLRRGIPVKRKSEETTDDAEPAAPPVTAAAPSAAKEKPETLATLTAPPAPQALIEKARHATEEFSSHLPNFVCQQFTTRYQRESRQSGWQAEDVVSATVVFQDGKEDYQNIKVGNKASPKGMMDIKGQRSIGEFGEVLDSIMDPRSRSEFHFVKDADFKRLKTKVYEFAVKRENANWEIKMSGQSILPAYSGRMWIDRESGRVLRIERQADNIPESFPMDMLEQTIDYDFVAIGTRKTLLPSESENLSCERGTSTCGKNVIEFRNYREFRGDATLDFEK